MTERKALVLIAGRLQQLPDADSLTGTVSTAYVDAGDTATAVEAEAYTDAAIAAIAGNGTGTPANGVVSGLGLVYTGSGLVWSLTAGSANINSELVTASAQTVTLAAADATNPRLDTFYLDDTGTFGKITGTAATNPSLPTVDPTSQLYLGFALVPATATDLTSTITIEAIYTEGSEWTGTASGSGVTIGSTNNPKTGTKSIEFTAVAANAYAKFVEGSPSSFDGTSSTLFSIRSQGSWNPKRSINIQYFNASGVAVGTPVVFKEGSFGFVSSNSSAYQDVVIPETLFAVPPGTVRGQLRFTVKGNGGTMGFYLDDIKVQTITAGSGGTGGGGVSSGITQDQADARYVKLITVSDAAYGAGWNGSLDLATKNAIYDKIETVIAGAGTGDMLKVDNLSGLANYATARSNLGLGSLATQSGTFSGTSSGTNTGDQTSIAGITGTKAQFNTACSDGDFLYVGDAYVAGGTDVAVADGGTGSSTASGARTNLGATTVGGNIFTLTNPSAITFLRLNADNSVDALSAAAFRTAIGAGTGTGSGDLVSTNNLSDLASVSTALSNLGLTYSFGLFFTTAPTTSEVLLLHIAATAFTLPANFATPTSKGVVGTNPTGSFIIDVQRQVNATGAFSSIGTITISTGGAFTFATASGTSKSIAVNDVLKFIAPSSVDASVANVAITIVGSR